MTNAVDHTESLQPATSRRWLVRFSLIAALLVGAAFAGSGLFGLWTNTKRAGHSESAITLLQSSEALIREGNYVAAEKALRQSTELDPSKAKAFNELGSVLQKLQKNKDAAEAFRKAIELEPGDATIHFNLAKVLVALDDQENALKEFETASQLRRGYIDAMLGHAELLSKRNEFDAAVSKCREAISAAPASDLRPLQLLEKICKLIAAHDDPSE
jgi:Tfp pilus assembly protein PilF